MFTQGCPAFDVQAPVGFSGVVLPFAHKTTKATPACAKVAQETY